MDCRTSSAAARQPKSKPAHITLCIYSVIFSSSSCSRMVACIPCSACSTTAELHWLRSRCTASTGQLQGSSRMTACAMHAISRLSMCASKSQHLHVVMHQRPCDSCTSLLSLLPSRRITVKSLSERTDLQALAAEIVDKCKLIHPSKVSSELLHCISPPAGYSNNLLPNSQTASQLAS